MIKLNDKNNFYNFKLYLKYNFNFFKTYFLVTFIFQILFRLYLVPNNLRINKKMYLAPKRFWAKYTLGAALKILLFIEDNFRRRS